MDPSSSITSRKSIYTQEYWQNASINAANIKEAEAGVETDINDTRINYWFKAKKREDQSPKISIWSNDSKPEISVSITSTHSLSNDSPSWESGQHWNEVAWTMGHVYYCTVLSSIIRCVAVAEKGNTMTSISHQNDECFSWLL